MDNVFIEALQFLCEINWAWRIIWCCHMIFNIRPGGKLECMDCHLAALARPTSFDYSTCTMPCCNCLGNTRNERERTRKEGMMARWRRKLLIQWLKMRCISSSGEIQQTVPYLDVHNDKLECNTCHHHSSTWTPRRILHMWYLATTLASDGHCRGMVDLLHCRPNERLWNLRIELLRNFQFLNVRRDFLHTDC